MLAASERVELHHVSFWVALIIVSAQRSEARVILSEDLQPGRRFGDTSIANPSVIDQPEGRGRSGLRARPCGASQRFLRDPARIGFSLSVVPGNLMHVTPGGSGSATSVIGMPG